MNRNNHFLGVLLGLLVPIFGVLLVYVIRALPYDVTLDSFILKLKTNSRFFSSTMSLAMIACIPLFTYYKNRRLYKTLYGIFIAVAFFALLIIGRRFNIF